CVMSVIPAGSLPPVDGAGGGGTGAGGGAGAACTVTLALPDFPSLVAVITAVPAATPLTLPDEFTVAVLGLLELQVMARPESTLPLASRVTAVACTFAPGSRDDADSETVIEATAAGVGVGVGVGV